MKVDEGTHLTTEFEHVVLAHLDAGYALAIHLMRNADDAEDVVQESVLRALRYFHTLRDAKEARPWFLAIVRRECYGGRGPRSARVATIPYDAATPLQLADPAASPEETTERSLAVARIGAAIADLPDPLREAIILREVHDLTYQEIAMITEVPVGTVMSRLSRARARLADALRDGLDPEDAR